MASSDVIELAEFIEYARKEAGEAAKNEVANHKNNLREIDAIVLKAIGDAVAAAGKKVCPACRGWGFTQKELDGPIMRRFGLRDWDGCKTCGGSREVMGRGFII